MKKKVYMALISALCIGICGCAREKSTQDRGEASEMYVLICKLTKEYTERLETSPDSADWAEVCTEFEDKLDKINFSYPPDTDLLLTEGQNDTIHLLMQAYVKAREERIHGILHPQVASDSTAVADSLEAAEEASELGSVKTSAVTASRADASHSPGN